MKRVCTLRKVYRSLSKVLLEKLFFIVLILCLFIATQFLLFLSYLQPGDMLWNRNPKYLYKKKFFPDFIATFATHILTCWYTVA